MNKINLRARSSIQNTPTTPDDLRVPQGYLIRAESLNLWPTPTPPFATSLLH